MQDGPFLLHCPSGSTPIALREFFRKVIPLHSNRWEPSGGAPIEVITYNNSDKQFPVELQMRQMGVKFHVLAKNVRPWKFTGKILPVISLLESGLVKGPLVLLIDGNDTIFTRVPSLEEVAAKLARYNPARIVFSATPANWPPDAICQKYESRLYPKPCCHLSTGGYAGDIEAIIHGLKWIRARIPTGAFNRAGGGFDDQLAWRKAHFAATVPIGIDHACNLFRRFGI